MEVTDFKVLLYIIRLSLRYVVGRGWTMLIAVSPPNTHCYCLVFYTSVVKHEGCTVDYFCTFYTMVYILDVRHTALCSTSMVSNAIPWFQLDSFGMNV